MGFCRRCGDIVIGTRCKCGGTAVAPVLQWSSSNCQTVDKWSQTYVSKSPTCSPVQIDSTFLGSHSSGSNTEPDPSLPHSTAGRFPRPSSSRPSSIPTRITPQIGSISCPPPDDHTLLPLPATLATDIPSTRNAPELSKAFGSVLQPKASLAPYSCAICLAEFQPDATIFPDLSTPELTDRFLCRPCFMISGGSKGDCSGCRRPVLVLKSEGGYVETASRVWHKKCFRCEGCHKNIGGTPMVDLQGQPSCADCFDSCLKRNCTPRKSQPSSGPEVDNQTPVTSFKELKSREGSPAIDELEQRLGIMKNREGSPVLEELAQRLNTVLNRTSRDSSSPISSISYLNKDRESSPLAHRILKKKEHTALASSCGVDTSDISREDAVAEMRAISTRQDVHTDQHYRPLSSRPSFDAIEEMKNRFMNQVVSSPVLAADTTSPGLLSDCILNSQVTTTSRIPRISRNSSSPGLRHTVSSSSLRSSRMSWTPSTPDLVPDTSDTLTQSSGPSSPPTFVTNQTYLRDEFSNNLGGHVTAKTIDSRPTATPRAKDSLTHSSLPAATLSSGSLCAKCGGSLFATGGSGRFVSVPELNASGPPKTYHTECFRCTLCDGPFKETTNGQAIFVRREGGACHVECAPTEKAHGGSRIDAHPKSALSESLSSLTHTTQTTSRHNAIASRAQSQQGSSHHSTSPYSSSRFERLLPLATSVSSSSSRFGSSTTCPGCQKAVSPMEMGVVPGPQGSKWHATCLVCGGKGTGKARRDKSQPGCGKRLDSAAKRDTQGGVWCRECLLLLPLHMRNPQIESAVKPLAPSYTGRSTGGGSPVVPQLTGATTIARQFTGRGGGDSTILRQLTGGGMSSTRQLAGSPTKQLGLATPRPRPKSVIGMRSSKSFDEGRGMYLVRQMTGGGGSFGV